MLKPQYQHESIVQYYDRSNGWIFLGQYDDKDLYVNHEKRLTSFVLSDNACTTGDYLTVDYDAFVPCNAAFGFDPKRLAFYLTESDNAVINRVYFIAASDSLTNEICYPRNLKQL